MSCSKFVALVLSFILGFFMLMIWATEDDRKEMAFYKEHNCEVVHSEATGGRISSGKFSYPEFRHTAQCDGFIRVYKSREMDYDVK